MTLGTFPFTTDDKRVRVIASGSLTNIPYLEISDLDKYDYLHLRFYNLTFSSSPSNGDYYMRLNNNETGVYEYIHALDKTSASESSYGISSTFIPVNQLSYQPNKASTDNYWSYIFENCRQPGYTTIHSVGYYVERNENQKANVKLHGIYKVEEPIHSIKVFTNINYALNTGNYELIGG